MSSSFDFKNSLIFVFRQINIDFLKKNIFISLKAKNQILLNIEII